MAGRTGVWVAAFLILSAAGGVRADEAAAFFDDSYVHEIRITFTDPDWYNTLYNSHANDPLDPYFPARLEYGALVLDPVGVRFKGNSSFSIPTVKKSFKFDFNEFADLTFMGLKKLNLNNSFKDPTMLREKLFLDFARTYVPVSRAVHTRLYVNGEYWGLYSAVEQVDSTFARDRFGAAEDGNLYKAESDEMGIPTDDFGSDLTWLGPDPLPYHEFYQLQTNEAADDYSQLIAFINVLNNTAAENLPALLEPLCDVEGGLRGLALNNLFVNIDAYNGAAHNYFLYDRDDTGQFTHIHWDTNEAFGRFIMLMDPWDDPLEMDPFWLPAPYNGVEQSRPLMEKLWAVDGYARNYLRFLARMLREGFDTDTMYARIVERANLIRPDVYADPHKQYTNAQFETGLTTNMGSGPNLIYGLRSFVSIRSTWLNLRLNDFAQASDLQLNELMPLNQATLLDGAGDYDPWLEIHNLGPGIVDLSGLYLTDNSIDPTQWALPAGALDDGDFLVLWLDGEPGEGTNHAPFALNSAGGELFFYAVSGGPPVLIDSVSYPALAADVSFGRYPDGAGPWGTMRLPTPGLSNAAHNTPPMIVGTAHAPAAPDQTDPVWVSCQATDDAAVAVVMLTYDAGTGPLSATMLDDGAHQDGNAGDDVYGGLIPAFPAGTIVHYYVTATDGVGAQSTDPGDAPTTTYAYTVGYTPPTLYINEFMADNDATAQDEAGDYDDWFELHNAGMAAVDLAGMYLTDDLTNTTKWQIPAGVTIAAGGHLLFWADEEQAEGNTHTNFKLSKSGEEIGLYDSGSHGNVALNTLAFGAQTTDVSRGRFPDGSDCWRYFTAATPGTSNGRLGDFDSDGSIDLNDYAEFPACLAGPGSGVPGGCGVFDFDCDGDVDLADFAGFQAAFANE